MPSRKTAEILTLGGAAAAIGGAYKLSEFLVKAKRIRDVGPANAVYIRVIARVRADLDEVRRLLTVPEVHDALENNPEKAKWVYGAIRDVRGALENIAPHTERVGGDQEAGRRIGIRHRLYWVLSEQEKLENREKELVVAHSSLCETIGYLTALEPEEKSHGHRTQHRDNHYGQHIHKRVEFDIDVRREDPERADREVLIEEEERRPRRVVDERETHVEREDHGPRHVEEHYVRDDRGAGHFEEHVVERDGHGPGRYEERETYIDDRGPRRYDEREVRFEREGDRGQHDERSPDNRYAEERHLHVERDPHDPRHVEARYTERGPDHYEEKRYEERRSRDVPLGRRPESFEDRLPERDTWMQSSSGQRPVEPQRYGRYGEYAEYGAAHYGTRKFQGDPGFGDDEVLNPQIVPPNKEAEYWIEEKEDFRYDQYGNRLPDRFFPNLRPRQSRL